MEECVGVAVRMPVDQNSLISRILSELQLPTRRTQIHVPILPPLINL